MPTKLLRKQFLLTEEENKQLEAQAEKEGLSVSNLTRKRHGLKTLEAGGRRVKTDIPKLEKKIEL